MDALAGVRRLLAKQLVIDGAIALVLTAMAQVQAGWSVSLIDRVLLLIVTGTVAWRRRVPLTTSLVAAAAAALMAVTPQQPSVFGEYLAVMLIAYTVAERCRLSLAIVCGVAMAAGVVAHDLASPDYDSAGAIAGDLIVPVLIWGVGRIVHFQYRRVDRIEAMLERLEQDRAELARLAVIAERAHMARELHDVVTHSVSVVVIQAQGAQRILDGDQPQVRQSLADIETAGRTALTEMRRLLSVLRDSEQLSAPRPGLAQLPALVSQVRAAGLVVTLTEVGNPAMVDGDVELSLYRIVQEALTNALKYAPQSQVSVHLVHGADAIEVRVVDDGALPGVGGQDGRGLLGMRERVSVYGGTLQAGPRPDGGFQVEARLPIHFGDAFAMASS